MHRASVSREYNVDTSDGAGLRFIRVGRGGRRGEPRPGVLGARAGRGRDPARAAARARADEVLVRTLRSGVSRGTETLVFRGGVPADQYAAMRAPFQEGDFPGPVKYGYLSVGVVEQGPPELLGRTVFCLYPHQTAYVVPADRRRRSCPTACRRSGRCSPGRSRPPSTRCGTRRPLRRRPGRGRGRGHGRLLRGAAARRHPGRPGHPGRRRPGAGRRSPRRSASRFARPGRRDRRLRPRRARQRDRGRAAARRSTCSRRRAR